jgi:hypothetical protein
MMKYEKARKYKGCVKDNKHFSKDKFTQLHVHFFATSDLPKDLCAMRVVLKSLNYLMRTTKTCKANTNNTEKKIHKL